MTCVKRGSDRSPSAVRTSYLELYAGTLGLINGPQEAEDAGRERSARTEEHRNGTRSTAGRNRRRHGERRRSKLSLTVLAPGRHHAGRGPGPARRQVAQLRAGGGPPLEPGPDGALCPAPAPGREGPRPGGVDRCGTGARLERAGHVPRCRTPAGRCQQIRDEHPGVPVYLLGHSMGGLTAICAADDPQVDAVVALAPWLRPRDAGRAGGRAQGPDRPRHRGPLDQPGAVACVRPPRRAGRRRRCSTFRSRAPGTS